MEKSLKNLFLMQFIHILLSFNYLLQTSHFFVLVTPLINQVIYITHNIFTAFEKFPSRETRAVFLDISKAFDKVWHEGSIFKLKNYGMSGHLLTLIEPYLLERIERVILNGKSSKWSRVTAGVP